jgi:hypothetical protein
MPPLNDALGFLFSQSATLVVSALAISIVTLAAVLKDQIADGVKWIIAPASDRLPWNRSGPYGSRSLPSSNLISRFTLVEVYLSSGDTPARYQKTSNYVVTRAGLREYREGVTCSGRGTGFRTLRGHISKTTEEHGFWMSVIDLDQSFPKGARFTNTYTADLFNSFVRGKEHWTQEIAYPTDHLAIHVHFPKTLPPQEIRCATIDGAKTCEITTAAEAVDLFGVKSIVWEIASPALHDIYKLEWQW